MENKKKYPELLADVCFNYDSDTKEFGLFPHGNNTKKVDLNGGINKDNSLRLSISFILGRKEANDDTITLTFNAEELLLKIQSALAFGEDWRES